MLSDEIATVACCALQRPEKIVGAAAEAWSAPWLTLRDTCSMLDARSRPAQGSLEGVVNKCYNLITRKLFSLPKLLLIPPIIARQVVHASPPRLPLLDTFLLFNHADPRSATERPP